MFPEEADELPETFREGETLYHKNAILWTNLANDMNKHLTYNTK